MDALTRELAPVPEALAPLIDVLRARLQPEQIWLFGSRARGDNRPDSDWDVLVSLADDAPEEGLSPEYLWSLQRAAGVPATVLAARVGELAESWGCPNTLAYDLARHGRLLHVRS